MKVVVKGKGEVTLTQGNFVAQGGQASVYQRNGTAFKVYTDPKDAVPEAKFRELAKIDDPNVIKPEALLLAPDGSAPVGYTMRFLSDTFALCQVFPKAFRERHGMRAEQARELVGKLRARVQHVHRAGALVVDLNELNVLTSAALDDVFLIDVDSFQVPGFPAGVIMPSVRDWSVKPHQFSELSDWFSFAILAFQIFIGIHPYRGTHAATAGVPPDRRLEERMRAHLSALGPGVSLPKACYPLDTIPGHTRAWMYAVLQEGKRLPPPDPHEATPVAVLAPSAPTFTSGSLLVVEVNSFDGTVLAHAESGSISLTLTSVGAYVNGRIVLPGGMRGVTLPGFTPKLGDPCLLNLVDGTLSLIDLSRKHETPAGLIANEIAKSGERFYVRTLDQVREVEPIELSNLLRFSSNPVANVMPSASHLYEGCAVQSMIGSVFVSLFPRSRAGYQVRVPELDQYRIMDAKFEGGVLMVVGAKAGKYARLVFRFNESFASYDCRVIDDITPAGLNFLVTHSGVCVCVTEDEKIEAFPVTKGATGRRMIEDPAIGGDMRLMHVNGQPGFARGDKLFTMKVR